MVHLSRMRLRRTQQLALLVAVLFCQIAEAEHYKLFVLSGQSNSLGTTNAGEADPTSGTDPADSHIPFFWNNIADATHGIGTSGGAFTHLKDQQGAYYSGSASHWGPEISFGRTLYRGGVRNFGIIKACRGGGGNTFWLKTSTDHHMYTHLLNTVIDATKALTARGDTFEIVGLLYLQGESDSAAEAEVAGTNFNRLLSNLRVDLPNATRLHGIIGGIAAAGTVRDTVRANQSAIGATSGSIDFFSNLDLQAKTASDNLHFNKAAKLTIGERFAQAAFSANLVARQYGRLVFIGDSITQGGNGDHPSYRYTVFKHLVNGGVPINATTGYKFTGSVTGAYAGSVITAPALNGQNFENSHEGHYGWRVSWEIGRISLPAGRYNTLNLGSGSVSNWTGKSATYQTADAGTLNYVGNTYTPDTVVVMIGINDLADGAAASQVSDDIGTLINQLRAANPEVRIHINKILHTNQGSARDAQVDSLNALLPALVSAKNAASSQSPIWLIDADTGFIPATQTYDKIHPNTSGEAYVGDRIAAGLGLLETPDPSVTAKDTQAPPHIESGSSSFNSKFEGSSVWNGGALVNGWTQTGALTKTLPAADDLNLLNPGSGGAWLEGTQTGWNTANNGDWTFEVRLKFNSNPNGFMIWLGTDSHTVLVEIHNDRTQDFSNNTFKVNHNNSDGQFHRFRIAHDAANEKYHVWRDGERLTPVVGVAYDGTAVDSRLILGDYTSGIFGNNFDVTLDYLHYDQTGAYLPTGADADRDGLPDSWEFQFYGDVIAAGATADEDGDGKTGLEEFLSNTNPKSSSSVLKVNSIILPGENTVRVSLNTSFQRNYTLEKSTDLGLGDPWVAVAGPTIGIDGDLTLVDSRAGDSRGFYRVMVTIP